MKRMILLFVMLSLVSACTQGSTSPGMQGSTQSFYGGTFYSKYNIHIDRGGDTKASYANYTQSPTHSFIPYGSQFRLEKWRRGFALITTTGEKIYYQFSKRHMKMSVETYINTILSRNSVSYDLQGVDKEGVSAGKVLPGMTKDAVMIALGYPATHRTPQLSANQWVYWRNRFTTRTVTFDNNGIVTDITPPY